ncbi:MAG TPA: aminoglycoside phosphotransferase family protein [Pilimelia sp.]|nr:aminoglycoside phosphotransferase family protein [Pilimelia sp.]
MVFEMPVHLAQGAEMFPSPERTEWVRRLPDTVRALAERWSLRLGRPYQPGGHSAWVAPARTAGGEDRVLKVAWGHYEAVDEAAGLRAWAGDGAVRVYDDHVTGSTSALLLERCDPGTSLRESVPEPAQDVVLAGLLRRLWAAPTAGFRPLQDMCDAWAREFEDRWAASPGSLDPGLARAGIALLRELPASADRRVLLCTDLHAANILAAGREPWLAIDPKPYVGDPAYDGVQHLLNCGERLAADPAGLARRLAGLLDVDPDRLVAWLFARCVQGAPGQPELGPVAAALAPAVR